MTKRVNGEGELEQFESDARLPDNINNPFFQYHYGMTLMEHNNLVDARAHLALALDGFKYYPPNCPEVKDILQFFPQLCYRLVQWQPRKYNNLVDFCTSLTRLREAGYVRHPRPQEIFGLIVDGILGRLNNQQLQNVYTDMQSNYGEWMSLVFERKDNILFTYLDPEGLEFNTQNNTYSKTTNFKYKSVATFNIAGKNSHEWIGLRNFDDELVKFLYGYSFAELPVEIQRRANIILPSNNTARPVCRDNVIVNYDVDGDYGSWASRGVR